MGNTIIRDIRNLLCMVSFQPIVGVLGLAIHIIIIKQLYHSVKQASIRQYLAKS